MAIENVTNRSSLIPSSNYSNRVLLKTIMESSDGGLSFVGQRLVIGGWVRSSKEVMKEVPANEGKVDEGTRDDDTSKSKDVTCVEVIQTRIPLFRSLFKVFGGTGYGGGEKPQPVVTKPKPKPKPSTAYLRVQDGSCVGSFQIVVESALTPPCQVMPTGTCILVEGVVVKSTEEGKIIIQLKADKIRHVGKVEPGIYPLSKKRLPLDLLREYSHFRPRTTTMGSIIRIRNALSSSTFSFFHDHGFLHVQVPIITTTDCEGFNNMFQVTTLLGKNQKDEDAKPSEDNEGISLEAVKASIKEKSNQVENLKRSESDREALAMAVQDLKKTNQLASQMEASKNARSRKPLKSENLNLSEDFFSRQTYLTVNGHLHLGSYACALGNVFSFGPRFHADKTYSAKHVSEMWMVETEMAFSQLEDAINCASDFFKSLCDCILKNFLEDMKFVSKRIDNTCIDRIQAMISSSFEKISYTEAVDALKKVGDKKFEANPEWGVALTDDHLSYLVDDMFKRPVVIYNHPKDLKPFYVRLNGDGKTVATFDMVVPKVGTLVTGSQNEERLNVISSRMKELGLRMEQYEWYLDIRRHGTAPHSGFTFRFDNMVLFVTGLTNARDVIPFPRSYGKINN